MDHRQSDFVINLESCRSVNEEAGNCDPVSDSKGGNRFLTSVRNGNGDGEELSKAENGLCMNTKVKDGDELFAGNASMFIDKKEFVTVKVVEKKIGKEKGKSASAKKPPKPPRPPSRGFSLDAADQKLIKEIADLAMIKRARIERMKAYKKMKAAKASSASSSSSGSFLAMLFTVFFFLVLLFQGMSSGGSAMSVHDSPHSGGARDNSFAIIQDSYLSTSTAISSGSGSPNLVEQASGLDHGDSLKRVAS